MLTFDSEGSQLVSAEIGRIVNSRRMLRFGPVGTETTGLEVGLNDVNVTAIEPYCGERFLSFS